MVTGRGSLARCSGERLAGIEALDFTQKDPRGRDVLGFDRHQIMLGDTTGHAIEQAIGLSHPRSVDGVASLGSRDREGPYAPRVVRRVDDDGGAVHEVPAARLR